jgi:aspartyl-tRNA(Asn)/glutamyl-tRNA(Gln) amidotransferase subunit C
LGNDRPVSELGAGSKTCYRREHPHEWHLFTGYHEECLLAEHVEQYLRWYTQDWCYNLRMSLTLEEVEHIADLARLHLTEAEKARFRQQLSAILDYVAQLQALDTTGIPPTSSVLPPRSVLRLDEPCPGLATESLLSNAPQVESDQFRVPPVLE